MNHSANPTDDLRAIQPNRTIYSSFRGGTEDYLPGLNTQLEPLSATPARRKSDGDLGYTAPGKGDGGVEYNHWRNYGWKSMRTNDAPHGLIKSTIKLLQ